MNGKTHTQYAIIVLCFVIIFFYYVSTIRQVNEHAIKRDENKTLENTGYVKCAKVFQQEEIQILLSQCKRGDYNATKNYLLTSHKLKNLISTTLSQNYVLQDYIWIIQKSMVHTCHRDNNGDFFNEGQKYPSYTMIIYLENMERCLSVLPVSHKHRNSYFFNFTTPLTDILCEPGDVVIFNANLIHVGAFNKNDDNVRIQMKISHKADIGVLSYYQNFNKVLKQENTLPEFVRKGQRSLSCTFPGISNLTQTDNIQSSRGTINGARIGWTQRAFSYLFYGKSDFYDLPNAF
jgi:Phytanoyl-CoA dioxygenase (PhyH)